MLTVVFDAFALGTPAGRGGIGTYQRQLLAGLAGRDDIVVHALAHDAVPLPPGVVRHRLRHVAPGRFAQLEHDVTLPLVLRRVEGDVVHSPAPYGPRRALRRPWVQTLFDVIPLRHDDPSLASSKRRFLAGVAAYQTASAVIAISQHAADEGVGELGLEPDRVQVVPLAVDPRFGPPPAPVVARREPYLLLVGQYDARKGFAEAFAVIGRLADRGFPHVLKVAGNLPRWVRPEVEALRSDAPRPERVELLGFVDDLRPLYWGAAATVVTSRSEGFGLPALEAMASGCPVVAFSNSSLPEVIADGGVLVADGDIGAFTDAVSVLLTDEPRRARFVEGGLRRAARFSEAAFVDGHVAVYERVVTAARSSRI